MDKEIQKLILQDKQIKKFSLYGFLKDLRFFEPYLVIFLMSNNLNLLQIGFLYSIREIIINIFEIPSGIIADYFGKKRELAMCFIFYIISFVFFFFSTSFILAMVAMVFFGLGEAFRTGTHKAMIYTYLEQKGWEKFKTFVYGKTRSSSLRGSAVSSILGIFIIINIPSSGYIFLASIIPYLIDFFLILSYPNSLDCADYEGQDNKRRRVWFSKEAVCKIPEIEVSAEKLKRPTIGEMLRLIKKDLLTNRELRKIILGDGMFEAVISSSQDFIQPILEVIIIGTGITLIKSISATDNLNIILGVVYAILHIFGSFASRKSYLLKKKKSGTFLLNALFIMLSSTLILLGLSISYSILVCLFFLAMHLIENFRSPIYIDELDNYMNKNERATMLSISSQMRSLFIVVLAPLAGFLADKFGMQYALFMLAFLMLCLFPWIRLKRK